MTGDARRVFRELFSNKQILKLLKILQKQEVIEEDETESALIEQLLQGPEENLPKTPSGGQDDWDDIQNEILDDIGGRDE